MMSPATAQTLQERSKIVTYIADAGKEISKLSEEIERLSPLMDSDVNAYRRVQKLSSARSIIQSEIRRLTGELQKL